MRRAAHALNSCDTEFRGCSNPDFQSMGVIADLHVAVGGGEVNISAGDVEGPRPGSLFRFRLHRLRESGIGSGRSIRVSRFRR